jgi:hypothetical protein
VGTVSKTSNALENVDILFNLSVICSISILLDSKSLRKRADDDRSTSTSVLYEALSMCLDLCTLILTQGSTLENINILSSGEGPQVALATILQCDYIYLAELVSLTNQVVISRKGKKSKDCLNNSGFAFASMVEFQKVVCKLEFFTDTALRK